MHRLPVLSRFRREPRTRRSDRVPRRPLTGSPLAVAVASVVAAAAIACTSPEGGAVPVGAPPSTPPTPSASATPSAAPRCSAPCRRPPRPIGTFDVALAPEASGIAASRRNPGVLYIVDDGPGTSSLLAVRASDGRAIGAIAVARLQGVDTEDLAVGPCSADHGASCIYIADIGDNVAARDEVTITQVAEPDLSRGLPSDDLDATTATVRYPDGPRDAEALLVGPDGAIVIITKEPGRNGRGAAHIFGLRAFGDGRLRPLGRLRLPQPSLPLAAAVVGHVVTAADAVAGRVVVRTYDAIFELTPTDGTTDLQDLASWRAEEIPSPSEPQGEAVAYGRDECTLFTVSEDSGVIHRSGCR